MAADLDLLAFAEDVAAGRRTLDNVIDQIAVAVPDDADRRRAVAELESLVVGLTGIQAHARATAEVGSATSPSAAQNLTVAPGPVTPRPPAPRRPLRPLMAAGATLVAALVVVLVVVSLRPAPSIGGPSPSPVASGSAAGNASEGAASPSPAATASPTGSPVESPTPSPSAPQSGEPSASVAPTATPVPSPSAAPTATPALSPTSPPSVTPAPSASGVPSTAAPSGAVSHPPIAIWRSQGSSSQSTIQLQRWDDAGLSDWFQVDARHPSFGYDTYRVLASPDGLRVAIAERGAGDKGTVRIVDAQGKVLWSTTTGTADPVDLAWSRDGTEFAFGLQPTPWTVVSFSENGDFTPTTYELTGDGAYRLITFTGDGNSLVGYETTGEAEFWEKPVQMDLARGVVVPITRFPAGLSTASTGPVAQIDGSTGDVLARSGGAKGPPTWVVRRGASEIPVNVADSASLAWTADGRIVASDLLPKPAPDGRFIAAISLLDTPASTPRRITEVPAGFTAAPIGARDGLVLLTMFPAPAASYPVDPGLADLAFVDLASGTTTFAVPPPSSVIFDGLGFGGWLGS